MSSGVQQPWFLGAPVTKLLSFATVFLYFLDTKNVHGMDSAKVLQGEWYRLWVGNLTFGTTGELVMGTLTLAHFSRRFERELGSRKFCVWLLQTFIIAIVLVWTVATTVMQHTSLQYAGPYATLGALLFLYYKYTPRLHPRFFGFFGFYVSEKVIPYAFAMQVILFRGIHTLVPALCGVLAGWLAIVYTMDVPDAVASSVAKCFSKIMEAPPSLLAPRQQQVRRQQGAARSARAAPPRRAAPPEPPSQDAIDQLTAMGFDRETVIRALQQSNNSVERALDRLLTGG